MTTVLTPAPPVDDACMTPLSRVDHVAALTQLLGDLAGADPSALDRPDVRAAVVAVERARAHLDALQCALLQRFDSAAMATDDGFATTRAWLRHRTQMSGATASRWVKSSRAQRDLPQVAEAFDAGRCSAEQVHAFASAVTPRTAAAMERDETDLLEMALRLQVDDLRAELRHWADAVDPDGAEPDAGHRSRNVRLSQTLDDQWFGTMELGPADGGIVNEALERMASWLRSHEPKGADLDIHLARTPGQRRADALVELVRRGATTLEAGVAPSRVPRPSVSLLLPVEDLAAGRPARTSDGGAVGGRGLERLRCDCVVEPIGWSVDGVPLSHGRARRFPTAAQRRAAIAQFGGCCFPGCDAPAAWADIHHIEAWGADGGPTDQENLAPVCSGTHHHLVHEGGWKIVVEADRSLTFVRPDGTVFDPAPGWN